MLKSHGSPKRPCMVLLISLAKELGCNISIMISQTTLCANNKPPGVWGRAPWAALKFTEHYACSACELFCSFWFKCSVGMVKMKMLSQQLVRKKWDQTQRSLLYLGGTQMLWKKWVWEPLSFLNFKVRRCRSPHWLLEKEILPQGGWFRAGANFWCVSAHVAPLEKVPALAKIVHQVE